MDDQIRSRIWRQLPEIPSNTARDKSIVTDPLPIQLRIELLEITDGENNPIPAPVTLELTKKIPSDESRGSAQEKFHGE
jgi:hypothetical protein